MNEKTLRSEHIGISGENPYANQVSAPRATMDIKMQAQMPVLVTSDYNPQLSGAEAALNLTYDVKIPHDGTVRETISKFPNLLAGQYNSTLVIYDRLDDNVADCLFLPNHFHQHSEFGFPYKPQQPAFSAMTRTGIMRKGTVLLDTPNRKPDGWYGNGRLLNVVAMSHPAVGDDGVAICEDVLDKFAYYTYSTHRFNVGANKVLINAYGTPENPQSFPNIGQKVRADGLLAAIRTYSEETAINSFTHRALQEPDELTDEMFLVPPNSIVVDVDIIHNPPKVNTSIVGIHKQIEDLHGHIQNYYRRINNYFETEIARGARPDQQLKRKLSDALAREIKTALNRLASGNSITKCYRRTPINEWLVTVTVMSINVPQLAAKFTGKGTADKGVITRILKPEEMPVTEDGVRADFITSIDAPFGRMTLGAIREPTYNAVSRQFVCEMRAKYEIPSNVSEHELYNFIKPICSVLANDFLHFHSIIGKESKEVFLSLTQDEILEYMVETFSREIAEIFLPIDREGSEVERDFKILNEITETPVLKKISFMHKGVLINNHFPAIIGKRYMQMLEQTAQDASASASSTMKVTGMVSHKSPPTDFGRRTPTITTRLGNSETRLITYNSLETYSDPDESVKDPEGTMIAELLTRNGSRKDHELCVMSLLTADKPGAIESLIDRKKHPYATSRVVGIFNAIALSQGYRYIQEGCEDDPIL